MGTRVAPPSSSTTTIRVGSDRRWTGCRRSSARWPRSSGAGAARSSPTRRGPSWCGPAIADDDLVAGLRAPPAAGRRRTARRRRSSAAKSRRRCSRRWRSSRPAPWGVETSSLRRVSPRTPAEGLPGRPEGRKRGSGPASAVLAKAAASTAAVATAKGRARRPGRPAMRVRASEPGVVDGRIACTAARAAGDQRERLAGLDHDRRDVVEVEVPEVLEAQRDQVDVAPPSFSSRPCRWGSRRRGRSGSRPWRT